MATVHFVGSVALDTPDDVFAAIGEHCGPFLKRVPDGEPGGRRLWISFQIPVLRANPSLAPVGEGLVPLKVAEGADPDSIHFGELGYAREARPSYQDFVAARSAGRIPQGVRFQVSLPTPYAVVMPFCQQPDAQRVFPAYERAMLREVERICAAIPHDDLAIQWDVCIEMLAWDGRGATRRLFLGWSRCSPRTSPGSVPRCRRASSSGSTCATAISTPSISSNPPTPRRWSRWRT